MEGVRTGARAVLRYFAPLYVVAIVVQVFLAGEGIFGIKPGPKLDDQKTLDAHRALGFVLADAGAILLLAVALLAWHPDKRIRTMSIALPFLLFIQGILGGAGRWGGAFHPLLAFVILGMFGALTHRLWRSRGSRAGGAPSVPVA
jgi:hypothetical protein